MIGLDLVDMSRIHFEESFVRRILTEEEYSVYGTFTSEKRRREYLAGRFASKEAIFKATQDPHYLHYSILNDDTGKPYVKDHPEMNISISHDGNIAAAIVQINE